MQGKFETMNSNDCDVEKVVKFRVVRKKNFETSDCLRSPQVPGQLGSRFLESIIM